jgi:hypothetical protein
MFRIIWINVYDSVFQFPTISSNFVIEEDWDNIPQATINCLFNYVLRCIRKLVVTPDTDWFSDQCPYPTFFKVSVTNRCISVFPDMKFID